MEPHALNNDASQSASNGSPGNVSDVDRELEAYLEEKQGKGDSGVDSQLAALRFKQPSASNSSTSPQNTDPQNTPPSKPDTPDQSASPQEQSQSHSPADQQKKDQGNSHESLIRALEEKYASTDTEHNVPPKGGSEDSKDAHAHSTPRSPAQPSENKGASGKPAQNSAKPQPAAPTQTEGSTKAVKKLKAAFVEPVSDDLNKAIEKLGTLPEETANTIVNELEPKFARNKERKELFEKTKQDLETMLIKRVETAEDGGEDEQDTKNNSSIPEAALTSSGRGSPVDPSSVVSRSHSHAESQQSSTSEEAEGQPKHESPEKEVGSTEQNKKQPSSFDVLNSQKQEEPKPQGSHKDRGSANTSPDQPSKKDEPAQSNDRQRKARSVAPKQKPERREQGGDTDVAQKAKSHAQKNDLLTVLSYDPEKGFVRTSAFDAPNTTVSVEVDQANSVARVQAKDVEGTVVSSADVLLADLA